MTSGGLNDNMRMIGDDRGWKGRQWKMGIAVTWLGHASVLVETAKGQRLVFDPWLEGNPKCPPAFYQLTQVDVIYLTHGHFDHIGSAVSLAQRTGAQVVANFEIASYLESQGLANTVGMNKGGTVEISGTAATMVYADHSSGISTDHGIIYGGEASGFVVTLEDGLTFYHAGDTNVFGDMAQIRQLYAPDLVMLPIGGHFTMGPKEAALASQLIGAPIVIPIHYGTFPILAGTPQAVADLVAGEPIAINALAPGETYRQN